MSLLDHPPDGVCVDPAVQPVSGQFLQGAHEGLQGHVAPRSVPPSKGGKVSAAKNGLVELLAAAGAELGEDLPEMRGPAACPRRRGSHPGTPQCALDHGAIGHEQPEVTVDVSSPTEVESMVLVDPDGGTGADLGKEHIGRAAKATARRPEPCRDLLTRRPCFFAR
jgi:hypothetical protein